MLRLHCRGAINSNWDSKRMAKRRGQWRLGGQMALSCQNVKKTSQVKEAA